MHKYLIKNKRYFSLFLQFFKKFQFEDNRNETVIDDIRLKTNPKMSKKKNTYLIKAIKEYSLKDPARFGINITFQRDIEETYGILMNYNLMCAIIVLVSSVNFLVDAKVVPGRAGVLVTLFLVLTNFFCNAQVIWNTFDIKLLLFTIYFHYMTFDKHIG